MFFLTLGTSDHLHLSATLVPIVSKIISFPLSNSASLARSIPSVLGLQKYYLFRYYQIFLTLFFMNSR